MSVVQPGNNVVIFNLTKSSHLNGQTAVVQCLDTKTGRWNVKFAQGNTVAINAENLVPIPSAHPTCSNGGYPSSTNGQTSALAPRGEAPATSSSVFSNLVGSASKFGVQAKTWVWSKAPGFLQTDPLQHDFKVLLLGQTGSGKTSFLNLLCNIGVILQLGEEASLAKLRDFHDIKLENNSAEKMASKTDAATRYNIAMGHLELCLIDSPGFGDTRKNTNQATEGDIDEKHVKKIIDAIKTEEYINCICLVINGREARMTTTLRYVLSEIGGILPRSAMENLIVVFTNTSNVLELNFDASQLQGFVGKPVENLFFIENPYVKIQKAKDLGGQVRLNLIQESLQEAFIKTIQEVDKMQVAMSRLGRVPTKDFTKVYNMRMEIELNTNQVLSHYADNQRHLVELELLKKEIKCKAQDAHLASGFKQTFHSKKWVFKESPNHGTFCGAPNCHSNCHAPCIMEKTMDNEKFKRCSAFFYTKMSVKVTTSSELSTILSHMSDTEQSFHTNQDGGGSRGSTVLKAHSDFVLQGTRVAKDAYVTWFGSDGAGSSANLKLLPLPATITFNDQSDQDTCNECGHHRKFHYHDEKVWVQEDHTETLMDKDLEEQYYKAQDQKSQKELLERALQQKIQKCKDKEKCLSQELFGKILQFEQFGLTRNFALLLQNQKDLLEEHIKAAVDEGDGSIQGLKDSLKQIKDKLDIVRDTMGNAKGTSSKRDWACAMLGVAKNASKEQIRTAYNQRARQVHPDKCGDTERMQHINEAYQYLKS